ncbi:EAL and HDOD domain-containing protein [Schlesneria paludicola]|uniref:EAL and HDOD domain-containing protein n=1 Tax=Schlesneria paludicola TaxID=360056 RepID=UPI00029B3DEC|nr:HDOD domain-containing protein [Schlesneria paludicola]
MTSPPQSDVFVGRQPIYDTELNIVAYELLFRSTTENQAAIQDADVATSQLLINSVIEIGLENLVFGLPAFVNFTQNFLNGKCEIPFDPELLVIEVLETVEPDDETIASLVRWRNLGFTIALDDYIESDIRARLLQVADIVKIDLFGFKRERLKSEVTRLKEFPLKLLAEKVETVEEFELCKSLGFDYFQGYFLSRPQVVEGKSLANNQLSILQLLVKLREPAVAFDDVVDLLKRDVSLSIKLLRYVNSLAHGVRRQIDSVRQAAIRLGLQKICQIVTLLAMNGLSTKPRPILETALIRAKMCEVLGSSIRPDAAEICFTVGLFSTLDAFLDRPLPEILTQLPITPEIRDALLEHSGPMGRLLSSVMAFERGDWDATREFGATDSAMQSAYLSAVAWGHVESIVAHSTTEQANN